MVRSAHTVLVLGNRTEHPPAAQANIRGAGTQRDRSAADATPRRARFSIRSERADGRECQLSRERVANESWTTFEARLGLCDRRSIRFRARWKRTMVLALRSDIHADREALSACSSHARECKIDRYVFLGDYVGYGADPGYRRSSVGVSSTDGDRRIDSPSIREIVPLPETIRRSSRAPPAARRLHSKLEISSAAATYLESSNISGASHQKEYPSFKP